MKKLFAVFGFILLYGILFQTSAHRRDVDFYYFYDRLEPYGDWIELNDGLVVWKPSRASHFWAPYKYGSWFWTSQGWYWDSDEPYGHIVYHYGRWHYDSYYGWIWVPDYDWAPAWVSWRYDDDYIGWAPLPVYASFSVHSGIHFSMNFSFGYRHWNFVRYRNFCSPSVHRYYSMGFDRKRIYSRTRERYDYRWENDRIVNRGAGIERIRERSNTDIRERNLVFRNDGTGRGNSTTRDEIIINRGGNTKERNNREIRLVTSERASDLDGERVNIGERKERIGKDGTKVTRVDDENIRKNLRDTNRDNIVDDDDRDRSDIKDKGLTRGKDIDENINNGNPRKDDKGRATIEENPTFKDNRGIREKRDDKSFRTPEEKKSSTREEKYNSVRGNNNEEKKSPREEVKQESNRESNSSYQWNSRNDERRVYNEKKSNDVNNGSANRDPYPGYKVRTEEKPRTERRNEVCEEKRAPREERRNDAENNRGSGGRERETKSR